MIARSGTLRKKKATGVRHEGRQAELIQQDLRKKPVGREETFLRTAINDQVKNLSIPNFCGSFWKSGRERLSS